MGIASVLNSSPDALERFTDVWHDPIRLARDAVGRPPTDVEAWLGAIVDTTLDVRGFGYREGSAATDSERRLVGLLPDLRRIGGVS